MNTLIFMIILPIVYLIPFEIMTYLIHKHVMHGFGWVWHRSHHESPGGGLDKNDLYSIVFSVIAVILFYLSTVFFDSKWLLSIAIGLTLYGFLYFLVHDFLIHRRIPNKFYRTLKNQYIKSLIRAHAIHHNVKTKKGAQAFGFLYAPERYRYPKSKL